MSHVKDLSGLFVDHVGVETFRSQQRHPLRQNLALILQFFKDCGKIVRPVFQTSFSDQAVFAMERVEAKIGQDRDSDDGQNKMPKSDCRSVTGRH